MRARDPNEGPIGARRVLQNKDGRWEVQEGVVVDGDDHWAPYLGSECDTEEEAWDWLDGYDAFLDGGPDGAERGFGPRAKPGDDAG